MLDSILEAIMQLKTFIFVSAIGIILVGFFLLIVCNKFSWNSSRRRFIGFFYAMKTWDVFGVSTCFIKIFLTVSFLVTKGQISLLHIVIFVILKLCYIIHRRSLRGMVLDIGLTLVSIIIMVIMNLLYNYLNDIIFDIKIAIVIGILGVLLCMYAIYDLFCCCNAVMAQQSRRRENN